MFPQEPLLQPRPARKVFVSYHHENDQFYANFLRTHYGADNTLIDRSLPEEIDSDDNDYILSIIRQRHLRDSTVTIVLIGQKTWTRKWVDWEIYSTLRPYRGRTNNGLLGILLPGATTLPPRFEANFGVILTPTGWVQSGYALLIDWKDIQPTIPIPRAPTPILPTPRITTPRDNLFKKQYLKESIEEAFRRRSRFEIHNNAPRFKINRSTGGEIY